MGKIEPKPMFLKGHGACSGCGSAIAMHMILRGLGDDAVVSLATGCMEVVSTGYPDNAWNVPVIHSLFENVPAVASGVSRALKKLGKKGVAVGIGGDGACYSPDTRVLTENGFKWVSELKVGEKIWSVNPSSFELELQPVEKLHAYFYDGEMICAKTRYINFKVTPNHKIPLLSRDTNKISLIEARELVSRYKTLLPRSFNWKGKQVKEFAVPKIGKKTSQKEYASFPMPEWLELVGWYVTEGCCYKSKSGYLVRIYQSGKKNRKEILRLTKKLGINAFECNRSVDFQSKQLFEYFKNNCGDYFYNKRIPSDLLGLSPNLLRHLFDAMIKGDGSRVKPKKGRSAWRTTFITKSSYLPSQFVELCLKLGKNCCMSRDKNEIFRIGVQEQHVKNELYSTRTFGKEKPQVFKEHYSGMVYCPQLPKNHTLIIERNGRVSLSGNSYDIGFGALSGAMERNEDMIYICYDNEAYENTGIQRSGATPKYAATTTSPVEVGGKSEWKKNLSFIAAAHGIPYVATASIAYPADLQKKLQKAKTIKGFKLITVFAGCQLGWRHDPSLTVEVARKAVTTGMWNLYEIENGIFKRSFKPKQLEPVESYLTLQGRFKHLKPEQTAEIQEHVKKTQAELDKLEASGVNLSQIL